MQKSKGHVAFAGAYEYIHGPDGTLYRAPKSNPLDLQGYRQGAMFECAPRRDGHKAYLSQMLTSNPAATPQIDYLLKTRGERMDPHYRHYLRTVKAGKPAEALTRKYPGARAAKQDMLHAVLPNPKKRTYKQTHADFMKYLESQGWTVNRNLKIPKATAPGEALRLWFKPQAIYLGRSNNFGDARTLTYLDYRDWTEADLRSAIVRHLQPNHGNDPHSMTYGEMPTLADFRAHLAGFHRHGEFESVTDAEPPVFTAELRSSEEQEAVDSLPEIDGVYWDGESLFVDDIASLHKFIKALTRSSAPGAFELAGAIMDRLGYDWV